MKKIQALFILLITSIPCGFTQSPLLLHGHSHNDYSRNTPLFEALEQGFTSIEIDVFSWKKKIKVSHFKVKLRKKPTIEELYLEPLKKVIAANNGTVFPNDSTQLILMIDLKKDKDLLFGLLNKQLKKYGDLFEKHDGNSVKWGPLKLVLSGNPPLDSVLHQNNQYFKVDLHFPNWDIDISSSLAPRASTNYNKHFKWKGKGEMPLEETNKLKEMVALAHLHNRKIRFWATPDTPAVWQQLLKFGVDWINVDDLKKFRAFYLGNYQTNKK